MTFMLSSVRSSANVQNDENAPQRSGSNKRKSISLLSSSPSKLKRIGRFSSLLSSSSSERDYDTAATRKSSPTCTISLENVTVINSFDLHTHVKTVSMDYDMPMVPSIPVKPKSQPLDVVDVNVIPFPSNSVSEPDTHSIQAELPSAHSRRRRSNHLLAKPQSSSAVKKHRRSHSSTISISRRAPLAPISLVEGEPTRRASSPPRCRRGDVKFTALVRRSVLVRLAERENQQNQVAECGMDVDEDGSSSHSHSDSVTLDILNEEADATLAYQDQLLVDRLGKFLAECGYREPLWTLASASSFPHVPSTPLSIEPRRPASPVLSMVSTSTSSALPLSDPVSVFDPINQPSSPVPTPFPDVDDGPTPVPSEPIPIPAIRRPSPPPPFQRASSSPRSTDPSAKILTPPQLVATLVLRHRDRAAIRPRSSRSFDDVETQDGIGAAGSSSFYGHMRRRSPLARYEAVSESEAR